MLAKKKYGQNFLKNDTIVDNIVSLLNATKNDLIIEIGPGMGALTRKMIEKNWNILCIEIDTDMKKYLDRYQGDNCLIIYDDILKIDLDKYYKAKKYQHVYVIGNLPYYITTPIIEYLTNYSFIDEIVIMVQNEVANRLSSTPCNKDYGFMTLFTSYYYNVSKEIFVLKNNFDPIPKVDSAVIKLKKRMFIPNVDKNKYFALLKDSFQYKRKKLKNNLSQKYDWEKVLKVLITNNLDENVRAEDLSEDIFIKICNNL